MSRVARITQKIFGSTGLTGTGGFGAAAAGTTATEVATSNTLSNIMSTAAWAAGWLSAVLGASKFPAIEDMNALDYTVTSQLAYLFQQGIPEWDSGTTYFNTTTASIVVKPGTAQLFQSLTDNNLNQALPVAPASNTNWKFLCDFSTSRVVLTGATTYYVATTGNDSNPGTLASPWLTIQHAINYVLASVDTAGQAVTISVADGTYASFAMSTQLTGGGTLTVTGNTTTPANCIISASTGNCINISSQCSPISIQGFKLTNSGGGGLNVSQVGYVSFPGNMNFGACTGAHIFCEGGNIEIGANYTISGGATSHFSSSVKGIIRIDNPLTVTVSGTPAFSASFANAASGSILSAAGITFSGSATGQRYSATLNSVIDSGAGGANYFPGNSAGATATGAQYN